MTQQLKSGFFCLGGGVSKFFDTFEVHVSTFPTWLYAYWGVYLSVLHKQYTTKNSLLSLLENIVHN